MAARGPLAGDARHWLCVFWINEAILDDVIDVGEDPDFSDPVPTWGICRPNIRGALRKGDSVTFVGFARTARRYLYKGSFTVAESLTYVKAVQRFPTRRNVIIRGPEAGAHASDKWTSKRLRERAVAELGTPTPTLLTHIQAGADGVYVHSPDDDHPVDNWKCRRIFRCQTRQLEKCLTVSGCIKEALFPELCGYIVADGDWSDAGGALIPWTEVAPPRLVGAGRTPVGQHNPMPMDVAELAAVRRRAAELAGDRLRHGSLLAPSRRTHVTCPR